jgi:hypothetical protein
MFALKVMILTVIFTKFNMIKKSFMEIINWFRKFPVFLKRIFKLLKVNHRSAIVWQELIKLHKKENWNFGLYENEKYVRTTFTDENNNDLSFHYQVTEDKLVLRSFIASDFNEDNTNDIMLLSSHFNSLLTFGMVRVNINNNYVEFIYQGDILTYMLYPGEIHRDIDTHFRITEDCYWAFAHMAKSGDEPVFVIAELLKRKEQESPD